MRVLHTKIIGVLLMTLGMAMSAGQAQEIVTPAGTAPRVQWAVVESTPGSMEEMLAVGARTVGPVTAGEAGSYALYGAVDKSAPDILRLLEIYENDAAYELHRSSEGFKAYQAQREHILQSLKILVVDPIILEQKQQGTGRCVYLRLIEVQPDKIDAYKELARSEAKRAVAADEGVMGLFITVEKERPNMVHTLELFADEEAYQKYLHSQGHEAYQQQLADLVKSSKEFASLPTNITLTQKGARK